MSNPFQSALDIVHHALRGLQDQGVELRASAASLARLAEPSANAAPIAAPEVQIGTIGLISPIAPTTPATIPAPAKPPSQPGAAARLAALNDPAALIALCPSLAGAQNRIVFGLGSAEAELMFIGDVPGPEEDASGEPFAGAAGQLLTKIIETMGFPRGEVYITSLIKCRPEMLAGGESDSRKPSMEELQAALPFLRQQIEIIQPRVLVALGASVMSGLLGETLPMSRLRGRWHEFEGRPLMATYSPTYLVRNQAQSEKRKVWEDMLLVTEKLGRPVSPKQRSYFLPKT